MPDYAENRTFEPRPELEKVSVLYDDKAPPEPEPLPDWLDD